MPVPTPSWAVRLGLHAEDLDADGHDTLGSSGLPVFTFEDYGAAGDGTTDDTTACQDTIDAIDSAGGGILLVGPKTYKITSTLNFAGPCYQVIGCGTRYGPSTIYMATNNTTALSFVTTSLSGFRIETSLVRNLFVKGPHSSASAATSGRGVYATSDVFCHEVGVSGFFEGFRWQGTTYYSYARDCFAANCAEAGFVLDNTNNCVLDNCRTIGAYSNTLPLGPMRYGAKIIGGSSAIALANRVIGGSYEYFSRSGLYVDGGGPVDIIGPYFETQQSSSGYAHIEVGASVEVKALNIEGAYLQGDGTSGFDAIKLDRVNVFRIHGCRFGINGAIGISSTGNTSNGFVWGNYNSPSGTFSLPSDTVTSPGGVTTADYLVGTSQSGLSSEIVVGTTPGGELGGTWASPTVDATHSGSAHTDFIAKAIVDAKGDLIAATAADTVARVAVGTDGQFLKADSGASAGLSWATPASQGVGPILVSDTPAGSPLVFSDLIQNEAGTDLVYADS